MVSRLGAAAEASPTYAYSGPDARVVVLFARAAQLSIKLEATSIGREAQHAGRHQERYSPRTRSIEAIRGAVGRRAISSAPRICRGRLEPRESAIIRSMVAPRGGLYESGKKAEGFAPWTSSCNASLLHWTIELHRVSPIPTSPSISWPRAIGMPASACWRPPFEHNSVHAAADLVEQHRCPAAPRNAAVAGPGVPDYSLGHIEGRRTSLTATLPGLVERQLLVVCLLAATAAAVPTTSSCSATHTLTTWYSRPSWKGLHVITMEPEAAG